MNSPSLNSCGDRGECGRTLRLHFTRSKRAEEGGVRFKQSLHGHGDDEEGVGARCFRSCRGAGLMLGDLQRSAVCAVGLMPPSMADITPTHQQALTRSHSNTCASFIKFSYPNLSFNGNAKISEHSEMVNWHSSAIQVAFIPTRFTSIIDTRRLS